MPHINIKHFPPELTDQQKDQLAAELTELVARRLATYPDAISIALEAVPAQDWQSTVYEPEIEARSALLIKSPNYRAE
ncbi:MAG: tautomerase PptA [Actinomycetota bacterium]|nr:tautomerase PptA [Actinomycetota bacterium]